MYHAILCFYTKCWHNDICFLLYIFLIRLLYMFTAVSLIVRRMTNCALALLSLWLVRTHPFIFSRPILFYGISFILGLLALYSICFLVPFSDFMDCRFWCHLWFGFLHDVWKKLLHRLDFSWYSGTSVLMLTVSVQSV